MVALSLAGVTPAPAQDDSARTILKKMSDYLAAQKTISATFDSDIEVVLPSLLKIQFTSSGDVLMSRPDKLRARRTGGYADVELFYDGATLTFLGHHHNLYAQINQTGSIDQLIDTLRDEIGMQVPGADFLLARPFDELTREAGEVLHIGQGVIDGVECEHLAFRGAEADWQLWVENGARPIPRKYVLTTKAVAGAPQYTLRIKTWATDVAAGPEQFAVKLPAGAKKLDFKNLPDMDEVPAGQVTGGQK